MLRCILLLLASAVLLHGEGTAPAAPVGRAAPETLEIPPPGRFKVYFQSFRTDNAAISPDGKYLAYSVREKESVFLRIVEVDRPEKTITQAPVIDDEDATPMIAMHRKEKTPGRILWLGWTSPTRVVLETNRVLPTLDNRGNWTGWRGSIVAFNADGSQAKVLASPDDVDEFGTGAGQREVIATPDLRRVAQPRVRATADQPVDENGPAFNQTENVGNDDAVPTHPLPDDRSAASSRATSNAGRMLRVLGYDPDRLGALIISSSPFTTYSLNTESGQLKALAAEPVVSEEDTLFDQQGRPRLSIPNTLLAKFPLRFQYHGPKGTSDPKSLDTAAGRSGFEVSPSNYFSERAVPLGFDYNSDVLYYATNAGRNTFALRSVNLATQQAGPLAMDNPEFDLIGPPPGGFAGRDALVFDHFQKRLAGVRFTAGLDSTAWLKPEWQEMQAGFERAFAGRSVKFVDWDQTGRRIVVTTEGPSDPGSIFVFDTSTHKLVEFAARAPWIDPKLVHRTLAFSCPTAGGIPISGLLTVPRQPRLKSIPVVVFCPDLPWERVRSDYQAEVQALAEMGFVVVQLDGRGTWGFGLQRRPPAAAGHDATQAEDIVAALDYLAGKYPVNPGRVALIGRGYGGFIALRTLQTYPDKFRCAIALDAPIDLGGWLAEQRWDSRQAGPALTQLWFGDAAHLQANPLGQHAAEIRKPVLMLNYPGVRVGQQRTAYATAAHFADAVRSHGTSVEFGKLDADYMGGLPGARAAVFDRIEEFLNVHLYDFQVKLHETQVSPEVPHR